MVGTAGLVWVADFVGARSYDRRAQATVHRPSALFARRERGREARVWATGAGVVDRRGRGREVRAWSRGGGLVARRGRGREVRAWSPGAGVVERRRRLCFGVQDCSVGASWCKVTLALADIRLWAARCMSVALCRRAGPCWVWCPRSSSCPFVSSKWSRICKLMLALSGVRPFFVVFGCFSSEDSTRTVRCRLILDALGIVR